MEHTVSIVMLVCLMGEGLVHAYPSGPPVGSVASLCMDMTPQHYGGQLQTSTSPFTLKLSDSCYDGMGGSITVTIQGNGRTFKGFFVQARKAGSNSTQSHGSFMVNGPGQKQLSCNGANNAIGHSDRTAMPETSFSWYPGNVKTDIVFNATVVQDYGTFWVGIKSEMLKFDSQCVKAEPEPTRPPISAIAAQPYGSCALMFAVVATMLVMFK